MRTHTLTCPASHIRLVLTLPLPCLILLVVGALVQNSYGSIGYKLDDTKLLGMGEFSFLYPQRLADGSIINNPVKRVRVLAG